MNKRARDPGLTLWTMRTSIWVHCPRCDGPASSSPHDDEQRFRLVCRRCAHVSDLPIKGTVLRIGDETDGRFGLPLYLATTVRGHRLWVYNVAHLDALSEWLGADLRERPASGPNRNSTMMSRLPGWMTAAAARPQIMKALGKLRDRAIREKLD